MAQSAVFSPQEESLSPLLDPKDPWNLDLSERAGDPMLGPPAPKIVPRRRPPRPSDNSPAIGRAPDGPSVAGSAANLAVRTFDAAVPNRFTSTALSGYGAYTGSQTLVDPDASTSARAGGALSIASTAAKVAEQAGKLAPGGTAATKVVPGLSAASAGVAGAQFVDRVQDEDASISDLIMGHAIASASVGGVVNPVGGVLAAGLSEAEKHEVPGREGMALSILSPMLVPLWGAQVQADLQADDKDGFGIRGAGSLRNGPRADSAVEIALETARSIAPPATRETKAPLQSDGMAAADMGSFNVAGIPATNFAPLRTTPAPTAPLPGPTVERAAATNGPSSNSWKPPKRPKTKKAKKRAGGAGSSSMGRR